MLVKEGAKTYHDLRHVDPEGANAGAAVGAADGAAAEATGA